MRPLIPSPMALLPLLIVLLNPLSFTTASPSLPSTLTLAYTPTAASSSSKPPKPKAFATLAHHPSNSSYTLTSYTAPSLASTSSSTADKAPALARIGLLPQKDLAAGTDGFAGPSTTAALQSLLLDPAGAVLRVVVDAEGAVLSVGLTPELPRAVEERDSKASKGGKGMAMPRLEIVQAAPEPRAVLNKPVVLDAQGKVPRKEEGEKTLLQR